MFFRQAMFPVLFPINKQVLHADASLFFLTYNQTNICEDVRSSRWFSENKFY